MQDTIEKLIDKIQKTETELEEYEHTIHTESKNTFK